MEETITVSPCFCCDCPWGCDHYKPRTVTAIISGYGSNCSSSGGNSGLSGNSNIISGSGIGSGDGPDCTTFGLTAFPCCLINGTWTLPYLGSCTWGISEVFPSGNCTFQFSIAVVLAGGGHFDLYVSTGAFWTDSDGNQHLLCQWEDEYNTCCYCDRGPIEVGLLGQAGQANCCFVSEFQRQTVVFV